MLRGSDSHCGVCNRVLCTCQKTPDPHEICPPKHKVCLCWRIVLIACAVSNVCSPKMLATVRVSPTQLSVLPLFCICSCARCWCCAVRCAVRGSRDAWCLGVCHCPPFLVMALALPLLGRVAGCVAWRDNPSFVATVVERIASISTSNRVRCHPGR